MSEPKAARAKKHLEVMHDSSPDQSPDPENTHNGYRSEQRTQPLLAEYDTAGSQRAPRWLQPFFSMRTQLTFAYCLVLLLMVLFTCIVAYQQPSALIVAIAAIAIIVIGTGMTFFFTTVLLRPLLRVTDAAQAIAIGDLKQRKRLPLRLPPQDEIDRLAGSLDEMVTRLEHAEEAQYASEERFRRFFSDASHQLRTPLTSIRGFTELLMRGAKDDPETMQRVLKRMKNEGERMTNLVNDLLTLARLDNKYPLKRQYIDLIDLAVEGIEQTRARASDERVISLAITTQERLGLQADKERIKQLLFILLDNALKHGRPAPAGTITLKLDKQQGKVVIFVIDNGEGIAKEDLEHIFEAFYRGRHRVPSNSTTPVGAGLGLTIASAIVRAHDGTITVCSEASKGTEFKVTLPYVD